MKKFKLKTDDLVLLSVLVAMNIILSKFLSLSLFRVKIGFAFLPIIYAARKKGPIEAAIVAGAGDFVRAIIFPIGPFFPLFTASAAITGFVSGLLLHKKCNMHRIICMVLATQVPFHLFLNTFMISFLYNNKAFLFIFPFRAVQTILMILLEIPTIYYIFVKKANVIDRI